MVEPVTTALAGIALVKKSVDFIKENIQTCQGIGQILGHVENAMNGEQQVIKARDKKGADPFATENVAQEIIDAKIAREQLNELRNLINLRFGPNTWQEILTERKRRIDAQKQAIKEARQRKIRQQQEIMSILKWASIGVIVLSLVGVAIYAMLLLTKPVNALEVWGKEQEVKVDPCVDYMTDVFVCLNQGPDEAAKHWRWVACPLIKQQPLNLGSVIEEYKPTNTEDQPFLRASKICQYQNKVVLLARECPKLISCK